MDAASMLEDRTSIRQQRLLDDVLDGTIQRDRVLSALQSVGTDREEAALLLGIILSTRTGNRIASEAMTLGRELYQRAEYDVTRALALLDQQIFSTAQRGALEKCRRKRIVVTGAWKKPDGRIILLTKDYILVLPPRGDPVVSPRESRGLTNTGFREDPLAIQGVEDVSISEFLETG